MTKKERILYMKIHMHFRLLVGRKPLESELQCFRRKWEWNTFYVLYSSADVLRLLRHGNKKCCF